MPSADLVLILPLSPLLEVEEATSILAKISDEWGKEYEKEWKSAQKRLTTSLMLTRRWPVSDSWWNEGIFNSRRENLEVRRIKMSSKPLFELITFLLWPAPTKFSLKLEQRLNTCLCGYFWLHSKVCESSRIPLLLLLEIISFCSPPASVSLLGWPLSPHLLKRLEKYILYFFYFFTHVAHAGLEIPM